MKKLLSFILPMLLLSSCTANNSQSDNHTSKTSNQNVLVAYFSVTNNTKKLANYAKDYLNSDIFEIVPTQEYTSTDIDYNSDCRANREQNDDNKMMIMLDQKSNIQLRIFHNTTPLY